MFQKPVEPIWLTACWTDDRNVHLDNAEMSNINWPDNNLTYIKSWIFISQLLMIHNSKESFVSSYEYYRVFALVIFDSLGVFQWTLKCPCPVVTLTPAGQCWSLDLYSSFCGKVTSSSASSAFITCWWPKVFTPIAPVMWENYRCSPLS